MRDKDDEPDGSVHGDDPIIGLLLRIIQRMLVTLSNKIPGTDETLKPGSNMLYLKKIKFHFKEIVEDMKKYLEQRQIRFEEEDTDFHMNVYNILLVDDNYRLLDTNDQLKIFFSDGNAYDEFKKTLSQMYPDER